MSDNWKLPEISLLNPVPPHDAGTPGWPVFFRSVLESEAWKNSRSEIPFAVGENDAGEPVVIDLAKAPHLLIAGSTGSGKSVCMNTLIASLLFRFSPAELKLILFDPKMVEMIDFAALPHLLTPVINDAPKAAAALRWAVNELEKRYRILAKAGAKNLRDYNSRPAENAAVLGDDGVPLPATMPRLVIIIDELSDLMMSDAKSKVEKSIVRIAQKGRAAGIHLVVSTQRPSRDIITGVIKANFPTRFCFRVVSGEDSRVVLDADGAEKLPGRGAMLMSLPGDVPVRIQRAWVPDDDLGKVVEFVCSQARPEFSSGPQELREEHGPDDKATSDPVLFVAEASKYIRETDDDLTRRAVALILLERKLSTSFLQRRLVISYNRAVAIINELEARKLLSPPVGGRREILPDLVWEPQGGPPRSLPSGQDKSENACIIHAGILISLIGRWVPIRAGGQHLLPERFQICPVFPTEFRHLLFHIALKFGELCLHHAVAEGGFGPSSLRIAAGGVEVVLVQNFPSDRDLVALLQLFEQFAVAAGHFLRVFHILVIA